MLIQQVTNARDRHLVREAARAAAQAGELEVQRHVVQRLFFFMPPILDPRLVSCNMDPTGVLQTMPREVRELIVLTQQKPRESTRF